MFAFLLEHFTFKLENINMMRHVIEVNCGSGAVIQKVYAFDSDLRILMFLVVNDRRSCDALIIPAWLLFAQVASLMLSVPIEATFLVF